jgi:hypothetical protein
VVDRKPNAKNNQEDSISKSAWLIFNFIRLKTMKNIFLFLSVIFSLSIIKSYAQTDTLAVLQNIVTNKASYIGQPFSVLSAQMPIGIKYFEPARGLAYNKNAEPYTLFAFFYSQNFSERNNAFPKLAVSWEPLLNRTTSAALFKQNRGAWSSTIASNYNSAVISDIWVIAGLETQ